MDERRSTEVLSKRVGRGLELFAPRRLRLTWIRVLGIHPEIVG
jgi:hypothetical protein